MTNKEKLKTMFALIESEGFNYYFTQYSNETFDFDLELSSAVGSMLAAENKIIDILGRIAEENDIDIALYNI